MVCGVPALRLPAWLLVGYQLAGFIMVVTTSPMSSTTTPLPLSELVAHTASFGDGGHCQEDYPPAELFQYGYDDPKKWVRAHNYYRACHGAVPLVWNESLVDAAREFLPLRGWLPY